jgi:hypothetical protein
MNMNRITRTLASSVAVAGCLIASAEAQDDNLVGTWECSMSTDDPQTGMSLNVDFVMTYDSDGSYEREGQMKIMQAEMEIDTTIEMKEDGTWSLDGLSLTESRSSLEFSSQEEEPSQIEQMILQGMEAAAGAATEETIELTSLTATTLQFDEDGGASTCTKA